MVDNGVMMLIASRRILFCTIDKQSRWQGNNSTQAILGIVIQRNIMASSKNHQLRLSDKY